VVDPILALILSCSLHADDALVRAFVKRVSDDNVYFVGDLATVTSHDHASTVGEALALVAAIEKRGGRPALGLMAIPLDWAERYGRSPRELFDGCLNIAIGTDIMETFASGCARKSWSRHPARRHHHRIGAYRVCILERFDRELGLRGYPKGVIGQLAEMGGRLGRHALAASFARRLDGAGAEDPEGAERESESARDRVGIFPDQDRSKKAETGEQAR
jgi:hypothetical protein